MNIKEIRVRRNLTQAEVANALGVSSVVYCRYETGARQPSIDMLIQMANIFDDSTLSDYERQLLMASRKADERAKQDALNMLLSHAVIIKPDKD